MQINRDEFLGILSSVNPGLAKREIVEQMTHYMFTGEDLVTYSGHICVHYPMKTDFHCTVKAEDLYKVVSKLTEDKIRITLQGNQLAVSTKNKKVRLAIDPEEEINKLLADIRKDLADHPWTSVPEDFLEGSRLCMFSASRDQTMQSLVCLNIDGRKLTASDDVRVSRYDMKDELPSFMMAASHVAPLQKYDVKDWQIGKSWIHFKTEQDVIFSSKRVIGNYPNYDVILDNEEGLNVELPENLSELVDLSAIMTEAQLDFDRVIEVTVGKGLLTCKAQKERGYAEASAEIKYDGENKTFLINPIFFGQVLEKGTTNMTIGNDQIWFKRDTFRHVLATKNEKRNG